MRKVWHLRRHFQARWVVFPRGWHSGMPLFLRLDSSIFLQTRPIVLPFVGERKSRGG